MAKFDMLQGEKDVVPRTYRLEDDKVYRDGWVNLSSGSAFVVDYGYHLEIETVMKDGIEQQVFKLVHHLSAAEQISLNSQFTDVPGPFK